MLLLVWWVVAAVRGPESFAHVQHFIASFLGRLLLFGWTWSLFFHLANGIRHLCWDAGWGFEIKQFYASGWAVVAASAALTLAAWIWGYAVLGGW
jgi:succinate dehydrogenase / fumarate reductase cytochrome b subunit